MPFTEETLNFLIQNYLTDSREWFHAHRSEYETLVVEPLADLVIELSPTIEKIDPTIPCIPKIGKCISRIWRDTRRGPDLPIYRDVMWVNFIRNKQDNLPSFWFEFSPRGMRWGCGWYYTDPAVMQTARELILRNDPAWKKARTAYKKLKGHKLEDTRYKRNRYPDASEELQLWLNQRSLCITHEHDDIDLLFSPELANKIAESFIALKPIYEFFMKAVSATVGGKS